MTQEERCCCCKQLLGRERVTSVNGGLFCFRCNEKLSWSVDTDESLIEHQRHLVEKLDLVLDSPPFSAKDYLSSIARKDKDKSSRQGFSDKLEDCQGRHRYKMLVESDEMKLRCERCGWIS